MAKCPNCNSQITCGCQKRVSTKGVQGCTKCITSLEKTKVQTNSTSPVNVKATARHMALGDM